MDYPQSFDTLFPDRQQTGLVTYDAKEPDSNFPPIEALHPPKGAPNVLIILHDDVGFGASSTFGGPINTPTAERLADEARLPTGRNHHSGGMGSITELATSAPSYSGIRPNTAAPLP
jgi:hypothetical protein